MSWGLRAPRRADDFDLLLERAPNDARALADDPRTVELLELVGALRAVPAPRPRPEFVADLRNRLVTEAETVLAPADVSALRLPARRTKRERRIAAVVGGLAVVGATTSVAMASQSALPGESLYPIKRVIESAHTGLALGEANKGGTELANASIRLDEVAALAGSDSAGTTEQIERTLDTFSDQATTGADLLFEDYAETGREASIAELRDFASSSMDQLADLEPQMPYDARDELVAAAGTALRIDAEAAGRCPDCGGTPIDSIPPALAQAGQLELPTVPATGATPPSQPTRHSGGLSGNDDPSDPAPGSAPSGTPALPELPAIDGAVPPGSVDPGVTPSATPIPLKDPTTDDTGAATGKESPTSDPSTPGDSTSDAPTASPSAPAVPLAPPATVLDGGDDVQPDVPEPIAVQRAR